jgi:replicative DNA helicase
VTAVPHNPQVEAGLIGRLLREPARIGEVVGTLLEVQHFYLAAHRLLYGAIIESFFADDPIDATVIGELRAKPLSRLWSVPEDKVASYVAAIGTDAPSGSPVAHAHLIKRDADYRALLKLSDEIREHVEAEKLSPEEIAGVTSQTATAVATSSVIAQEQLVSFGDAGRAFILEARQAQQTREAGLQLGAYFGLRAIDDYTSGLRGGEVLMAGGEPGVGKSAVFWKAALNFAAHQGTLPVDKRVGTLILSLEMGASTSSQRFASMLTGTGGTDLRTGDFTADQLQAIVGEWRTRAEVPLWLNYAPTLRASQMRALISEGIRRHNVGLVVIDHFRMFDLDRRLENKLDEDEEKVRFLKEQLAGSFNVAVVCLAHTRKPQPGSNGRPRMEDLRGSYQVAAHADFVGFVYRPAMYAKQKELDAGEVVDTDAEMIWAKNRHGKPGSREFYFAPERMFIAN